MRSVVVYESVCGNTGHLAHAIADVLAAHGSVELVAVGQATSPFLQGADLLVVGAPTHMWGMSWPWTRRIANRSSDRQAQPTVGMREWLRRLGPGHGQMAAAFDTGFESLLGLGSASHGIARRLRRRGYRLVVRPARFFVETTDGPLGQGEKARAQKWAAELVATISMALASTPNSNPSSYDRENRLNVEGAERRDG
jgi:hypothetical protein